MARVPKRPEENHKHLTKAERAEREQRKAPGAEQVDIPPAGDWSPQVVAFYNALAASGQSRFYEPSDWAMAHLACEYLDRSLPSSGEVNARALAEVNKMLRDLMVTEGARRKLHLELQRPQGGWSSLAEGDTPGVTAIEDYKNRITG